MPREREPSERLAERRRRLRRGTFGELVAAMLLVAKGYRIMARRQRTPYGEVDIIARRGSRIAFVEVKRRRSLDDGHAALTPTQARRIGAAADWWIDRHPRWREHEIGLDAVLVVPGRLPRHLRNALDGW